MDNKQLVRIAKRIAASEDSPKVYVGTYAKYNDGNLEGKWVDLEDFASYDDFLEECKQIHSDETDPEFMFQDYEGFPSVYYTESGLKPELWDYIEKIKEYDKDIVDAVLEDGGSLDDVDDAIFYDNCVSMTDVAYALIDETGGVESLGRDTLERYFDYDSYGRDLDYEEHFIPLNGGYLWIR